MKLRDFIPYMDFLTFAEIYSNGKPIWGGETALLNWSLLPANEKSDFFKESLEAKDYSAIGLVGAAEQILDRNIKTNDGVRLYPKFSNGGLVTVTYFIYLER